MATCVPLLAAVSPLPPLSAVLRSIVRLSFVVQLMRPNHQPPQENAPVQRVCARALSERLDWRWKWTWWQLLLLRPTPLLTTSLCRDFHSAPPPLIWMQTHARNPCWGMLPAPPTQHWRHASALCVWGGEWVCCACMRYGRGGCSRFHEILRAFPFNARRRLIVLPLKPLNPGKKFNDKNPY